MSDEHLEKVLVMIDYKAFCHCLGQIHTEVEEGLHASDYRQNFINIRKIARKAVKVVDTDTNDLAEVVK